jgi:hypothetical protein
LESRRRERGREGRRTIVEAASRGEDEEGLVEGHGVDGRDEEKSQRFEGSDVLGGAAGSCG